MKFEVLTIFPELFERFTEVGLVSRALEQGQMSLTPTNLREFALNSYGQIDDTPYGGGSGMVLRAEPACAAIRAAKSRLPNAKVVLFTPRGKPYNQAMARELASDTSEFILLCTRYEGVDQRVIDAEVDIEVSMGDYILMGGEVPAMSFIESTVRLLPGVLGNAESTVEESFEKPLLEYPHYTKPQEFETRTVPEVLLSGNHAAVATWRAEQALADTAVRRPDLLRQITARTAPSNVSAALIHHPVLNKQGSIITSSITNIDLHDISRSAKTFGLHRLYIVHPVKTMRRLIGKICDHWATGYGATYNRNRSDALELISLVPDFDDMILQIEREIGTLPKIVSTSAKPGQEMIGYDELHAKIRTTDDHYLILFGTGWGLADEVLERADYRLEPVYGPTDYNHLSVRSAAAIIFSRLFGS